MNVLVDRIKINDHTCNWYCSWILATLVFLEPVQDFISYFGEHYFGLSDEYVSLFVASIVFIILIIPAIFRIRITVDAVLVVFFVFISWFVSLISHMEYSPFYYKEAWHILVVGCPMYFIAKNITDYEECYGILQKAAVVGILFMFVNTFVGVVNGDLFASGYDYTTTGGIKTVPSATILLLMYFDKKKPVYLITFLASVALMIFHGGRSSLLCLIIAVVLILFELAFMKERAEQVVSHSKIGLLIMGCIACVGAFVFASFNGIRVGASKDIPGMRIINMIKSGNFLRGSGRWEIWESAMNYIVNHPFIGSGILYDRVILAGSRLVMAHYGDRIDTISRWTGIYAHNLFLEFLMQYGVLIGMILCIIVMISVIILMLDDCKAKRRIAIFLISFTLGYYLLSGTVFRSRSFWAMLAMASSVVLRRISIRRGFTRSREV